MRISWVGFSVLIASNPGYAIIYKWADNHKCIHFSDSPHKGSKPINLSTLQHYSSLPSVHQNTQSDAKRPDINETMSYALTIIQPENKTTIRNTAGLVSLMVSVQPNLKKGDKLQVMVDGSPMGNAQASTAITLRHINRGSHVLCVQRIDATGVIRAISHPISFYMMPPKVTPLKF